MKYSEFKNEVESSGYEYLEDLGCVSIISGPRKLVTVSTEETLGIYSDYEKFHSLEAQEKGRLFNLCHTLGKTPLVEREEEKRYRLKLVTRLGVGEIFRYLNLNKGNGEYFMSSQDDGGGARTIFTESEIAKMDITGFEKVEVTDGE